MRQRQALHRAALFVAIVVAVTSLPSAVSLKVDIGHTSDDSVTYFGQFCWSGQGGSLTGIVSSTVSNEVPLRILLCNKQDTTTIRYSGSSASACSVPSGACTYDKSLFASIQGINISNPEGFFGLFVLNCQSKTYTIDMHLLFLNPGNEGLSCEYIGMPTITRRLASLWSVAFGICIFDVVFHYLYKTRRVDAWLTCQRVQPWVPVCVAARVIHLFLAMKTFDDQSSVGRSSTSTLLVMYFFGALSEGSILAVCLLFSKGHVTLTNTSSFLEKKQVIFVGLWVSISVFLNDLFRGFFLFSLIIAYICLCRIMYRRCTAVILALNAAARNARNLNNNAEGAKRMEWKAIFFRTMLFVVYVYAAVICIIMIIIAFVPYVKDLFIAGFLIRDILLFLIFVISSSGPRLLQWKFNYALEHEIADQMPQNDQFVGNGLLAGIFEARNFRQIETTETFCRSVHVVVPPFDEAAGEYPVVCVAMHADERDDPARLNPGSAFLAAGREEQQPATQQPQQLQRPQYSLESQIEMHAIRGSTRAARGGSS